MITTPTASDGVINVTFSCSGSITVTVSVSTSDLSFCDKGLNMVKGEKIRRYVSAEDQVWTHITNQIYLYHFFYFILITLSIRQSCITADPCRLVAQLTSTGGSVAVFHVQFQNQKLITLSLSREG